MSAFSERKNYWLKIFYAPGKTYVHPYPFRGSIDYVAKRLKSVRFCEDHHIPEAYWFEPFELTEECPL